ncbi:hypothetical protein [Actinoplanes sp. NPDC026619]|uniref:hypothetical protein n=1 Tax=Actinoplanes sp. NPDC026619 TaxID=3155798 RepID=UPI0033DD464F
MEGGRLKLRVEVRGAALAQRPGASPRSASRTRALTPPPRDRRRRFPRRLHPARRRAARRAGDRREIRFAGALEKVLTRLGIGDPARGAGLIVALATGPAFTGRSGGYYTVRGTRQIQPAPPGNDPNLQAELWDETQRLLEAE